MAQYQTKQELVNAEKWKGDNYTQIFEFLGWDVWDKRDNSASGPLFSISNAEGDDGILYVNETDPVTVGDYLQLLDNGNLIIVPSATFEDKYILTVNQ